MQANKEGRLNYPEDYIKAGFILYQSGQNFEKALLKLHGEAL